MTVYVPARDILPLAAIQSCLEPPVKAVTLVTLCGLRDFITEEFCGYRLSPIRRSYSPGCELSFQFENFCPICHKRGQCLSVVQKTNGSLFYQCFHPDADDLLCGLGVQRKSIPKLMAIIGEGENYL